MALNLGSLATKDQATLHLVHPDTDAKLYDSDGNAVEIVMRGKSSSQYRNAFTAMRNRYINRGKKKASAELHDQEGIELLASCCVQANNLTLPDGRAINSFETFVELFSDVTLEWVKDQCDNFLGDVANFLGK